MKIELPLTVRDRHDPDRGVGGADCREGLSRAELGVEHDNPRAKALYEGLGYVAFTRRAEAWDAEAPNGEIVRYETVCDILAREL